MKKIFLSAIVAVSVVLTSCGQSVPSAKLNNDIDTLSYAIGVASTQGLKDHLTMRMGVDTAYNDAFIKGLLEAANSAGDKKKAAYVAGLIIGQQIVDQNIKGINNHCFGDDSTKTISIQNFMSGFVNAYNGKDLEMNLMQADSLTQALMAKFHDQTISEQFADNREKGEAFLAENANNDSVVVLPSGVQYKILKAGKGATPTAEQTVKIHYEGSTVDGTVFDSSYKRNNPIESRADGFVKGFTEALCNMPVGSTWMVYIPQELAYGNQHRSSFILPYSALVFKIELISIKK